MVNLSGTKSLESSSLESNSIADFLEMRTRRISLAFIATLGAAMPPIALVFYFVVANVIATAGALAALAACVISWLLVRSGRTKTGNALFFGVSLVIILAVGVGSLLSAPAEFTAALISVVALLLVVIQPTGVLISAWYTAGATLATYGATVALVLVSGDEMLISRIPLFAVVFAMNASITVVLARVQNQLIEQTVEQAQRSDESNRYLKDIVGRVHEMQQQVGASEREVAESLDEFGAILSRYRETVSDLSEKSEPLASEVSSARESLSVLEQSVAQVSESIRKEHELVEQSAASQNKITASLREMSGQIAESEKRNDALSGAAQRGREQVDAVLTTVDELSEHQKRLGEINTVVRQIGAQTGILSMNAAIEAAHAGEAGRGFSVVAEEVRKLSDESNARTREISDLVKSMNAAMAHAVETIRETGNALVEVDEQASAARPVTESIRTQVDSYLETLSAMNRSNEELRELTSAISAAAARQTEVFTGYTETFSKLNETIEFLLEKFARLEELSSNANTLMERMTRVRERNAEMERRIEELTSFANAGGDGAGETLGACRTCGQN